MAPSHINAVESILALMITDSLSQISNTSTILGALKGLQNDEWISEILPKCSVFGTGGSAFNYTYREGDQATKFEARITMNGYGYEYSTATLLSTLVLFIYNSFALTHVVYSICFGKTTSSSWESITELIALAVNSKPFSTLQNTGAGIATLGTLKQSVRIGVSDNRVQMAFKDEEKLGLLTPGQVYG